jgi:hypothetical protein
MNDFLKYLLESGISLAALYTVYLLLLRKETCFTLIRFYLLASVLFSLALPLVEINPPTGKVLMRIVALNEISITATNPGVPPQNSNHFGDLLFYLYIAVSAFFMVRLLVSTARIIRLIFQNRVQSYQGYKIVYHKMYLLVFSFFTYIFVSETSGQSDLEEVTEHERAHIRQWHSLDIVLAELLIILQWWNPFTWLYRRTISENHEFLADKSVLSKGYNTGSYQMQVISQIFGIHTIPLTNNFNKSIINKRIDMMEKNRSSRFSGFRFLPALAVALVLFLVFACGIKDSDKLSDKGKTAESLPDTSVISLAYLNPDEPAAYPGGVEALMRFVAENIQYPEEAKKKGIEGKLFIRFVVDETGKVIPVKREKDTELPPPPPPAPSSKDISPEAKTVDTTPGEESIQAVEAEGIVVVGFKAPEGTDKSYTEEDIALLEQEAIRVIKSIPPFERPAVNEGKPVRSLITIPINFKLK